jgi:hypothetical protein
MQGRWVASRLRMADRRRQFAHFNVVVVLEGRRQSVEALHKRGAAALFLSGNRHVCPLFSIPSRQT